MAMSVGARHRLALGCVLANVPAAFLAIAYLRERDFARATVLGQLLDSAVLLLAVAVVVTLVFAVARHVWRRQPDWVSLWAATACGVGLALVLGLAVWGTRAELRQHAVLVTVAAGASVAAGVLLTFAWPPFRGSPMPSVRRLGTTLVVGVLSVSGLQAWNALAFAPEQQEASLTTTIVAKAVRTPGGGHRVTGTVTVKNDGDAPALLVASQYVVLAVSVQDREDWPLGASAPDPLEPVEIADNGAGARRVIGTGLPFRPYQRLEVGSSGGFDFALLSDAPEPAVRVVVRLFSARADRLFVSRAAETTPAVHAYGDERGSQLVKNVLEGSRLRAFSRQPVDAVATWWHVPSATDGRERPDASVYFYQRGDVQQGNINDDVLPGFGLSRQFYETTVFIADAAATATGS